MFQIGDKIIYPMHGAGKIKSIEEKEISGKKQKYYIIKMLTDNMEIMIPKNNIKKSSIRPVSDLDVVNEVAKIFQDRKYGEALPWKQRNKVNADKMKTGAFEAYAEVVSDLIHMQKENKLNFSEKRMLEVAREHLIGELKSVEGISKNQVEKFLLKLV